MRLLICVSILLTGCADADKLPQGGSPIEVTGYLQYESLDEASGLARSYKNADQLWVINDDDGPILYAINTIGAKLGKVNLVKASNRDWEDLASFSLEGQAYLVIADIGDNLRRRKIVTLYVVEEPDIDQGKTDVAWRIDFSYPEGPTDAEAIAVDVAGRRILVLSKRNIPAVLYAVPLMPDTNDTVIATRLGEIDSLPQPSQRDTRNAADSGWYWQPTAMDISADGGSALILTYRGIYHYSRNNDEPWIDTLRNRPLGLNLGKYRNAEAIAFAPNDNLAFVTIEKMHAPLLRIDLSGAVNQ
ncbi:MAG: hypothetical protein IIA11_04300 [Proteobacteria bacterium]|nr:hypothetical protein [Pseudomonadota bacterium]